MYPLRGGEGAALRAAKADQRSADPSGLGFLEDLRLGGVIRRLARFALGHKIEDFDYIEGGTPKK